MAYIWCAWCSLADQTLDCHKQECTGYWWGRELNNDDMLTVAPAGGGRYKY